MRVAIMQPYFYPYAGYFELVRAVDRFVFLTDVQYARRGWINRNRIRTPGGRGERYVTVPVRRAPRDALIRDILIADPEPWRASLCRSLQAAYGRNAVEGHPVYQHLRQVPAERLCPFLSETVLFVSRFLGLNTPFSDSADAPLAAEALDAAGPLDPAPGRATARIIRLCKALGATTYVNAPGGVALYDPADFARHGLRLEFMPPTTASNRLSILDLCLGDGLRRL